MRHYIKVRRFRLENHRVKGGEWEAMECLLEGLIDRRSRRDANNATAISATAKATTKATTKPIHHRSAIIPH